MLPVVIARALRSLFGWRKTLDDVVVAARAVEEVFDPEPVTISTPLSHRDVERQQAAIKSAAHAFPEPAPPRPAPPSRRRR